MLTSFHSRTHGRRGGGLDEGLRGIVQPRLRQRPGLLEGRYFVHLLHGEADIVQAVEQTVLTERIDLERDGLAAFATDDLIRKGHIQELAFSPSPRLGLLG